MSMWTTSGAKRLRVKQTNTFAGRNSNDMSRQPLPTRGKRSMAPSAVIGYHAPRIVSIGNDSEQLHMTSGRRESAAVVAETTTPGQPTDDLGDGVGKSVTANGFSAPLLHAPQRGIFNSHGTSQVVSDGGTEETHSITQSKNKPVGQIDSLKFKSNALDAVRKVSDAGSLPESMPSTGDQQRNNDLDYWNWVTMSAVRMSDNRKAEALRLQQRNQQVIQAQILQQMEQKNQIDLISSMGDAGRFYEKNSSRTYDLSTQLNLALNKTKENHKSLSLEDLVELNRQSNWSAQQSIPELHSLLSQLHDQSPSGHGPEMGLPGTLPELLQLRNELESRVSSSSIPNRFGGAFQSWDTEQRHPFQKPLNSLPNWSQSLESLLAKNGVNTLTSEGGTRLPLNLAQNVLCDVEGTSPIRKRIREELICRHQKTIQRALFKNSPAEESVRCFNDSVEVDASGCVRSDSVGGGNTSSMEQLVDFISRKIPEFPSDFFVVSDVDGGRGFLQVVARLLTELYALVKKIDEKDTASNGNLRERLFGCIHVIENFVKGIDVGGNDTGDYSNHQDVNATYVPKKANTTSTLQNSSLSPSQIFSKQYSISKAQRSTEQKKLHTPPFLVKNGHDKIHDLLITKEESASCPSLYHSSGKTHMPDAPVLHLSSNTKVPGLHSKHVRQGLYANLLGEIFGTSGSSFACRSVAESRFRESPGYQTSSRSLPEQNTRDQSNSSFVRPFLKASPHGLPSAERGGKIARTCYKGKEVDVAL